MSRSHAPVVVRRTVAVQVLVVFRSRVGVPRLCARLVAGWPGAGRPDGASTPGRTTGRRAGLTLGRDYAGHCLPP
jgi:hypothetical protein